MNLIQKYTSLIHFQSPSKILRIPFFISLKKYINQIQESFWGVRKSLFLKKNYIFKNQSFIFLFEGCWYVF